jgi:hypothetical protein
MRLFVGLRLHHYSCALSSPTLNSNNKVMPSQILVFRLKLKSVAVPPDDSIFDLLSYWKAKKYRYPRLATMALEILSVPAMSAEVERILSSAKLTLSERRARLDCEIVEALECLRHWDDFIMGRIPWTVAGLWSI